MVLPKGQGMGRAEVLEDSVEGSLLLVGLRQMAS